MKATFHFMVLSFRIALQICKLKLSTLPKLAILMPTLCRINPVKSLIVMTSELTRPCILVKHCSDSIPANSHALGVSLTPAG